MQTHRQVHSAAVTLCSVQDLMPGAGVAALAMELPGEPQIALFFLPNRLPNPLPDHEPDHQSRLFAISNHDPFSGANVLSRGIVGDKGGQLVVASPLYKQHFALATGICVEQPEVVVPTYRVELIDDRVVLYV